MTDERYSFSYYNIMTKNTFCCNFKQRIYETSWATVEILPTIQLYIFKVVLFKISDWYRYVGWIANIRTPLWPPDQSIKTLRWISPQWEKENTCSSRAHSLSTQVCPVTSVSQISCVIFFNDARLVWWLIAHPRLTVACDIIAVIKALGIASHHGFGGHRPCKT